MHRFKSLKIEGLNIEKISECCDLRVVGIKRQIN